MPRSCNRPRNKLRDRIYVPLPSNVCSFEGVDNFEPGDKQSQAGCPAKIGL